MKKETPSCINCKYFKKGFCLKHKIKIEAPEDTICGLWNDKIILYYAQPY